MLELLALRRIPEWLSLSKKQRAFVYEKAVHPRLIRWPVLLLKTALIPCILVPACVLNGLLLFVVYFIGTLLPGEIIDSVLVKRHRQEIVDFIASHQGEIQAVGRHAGENEKA